MNLQTMRRILRRQVHDYEGITDQWDNAEINQILNVGLAMVHAEVTKVNPQAGTYIDLSNLVAGSNYYFKPTGLLWELELAISSDGVNYTVIEKRDYEFLRRRGASLSGAAGAASTYYSHLGRYFYLDPAPAASVVNGLRVVGVGVQELAADTDVPYSIPLPLHFAIVLAAKIMLLEETEEEATQAMTKYNGMIADIGSWYHPSGGIPEQVYLPEKEY